MTTLLLTGRFGRDDQALWQAALRRGWKCERLRGPRVPAIDDSEIVVYAEAIYGSLIERALGLRLLEVPDAWLAELPHDYRQREITLTTLAAARELAEPRFIKPPNDKSFKSRVYAVGSELPAEYDSAMNVLVAEPVEWQDEFRCFLLRGKVRTVSVYLRSGRLAELDDFVATHDELSQAACFAEGVAAVAGASLPAAVALDVGQICGRGWAVVEANGAWGSGIYGCDPDQVLEVIRFAVAQRESISR